MIRAAIILLLLTGCAVPDRLHVLTSTDHVGAPDGYYEEQNPGLALTWEGCVDRSVAAYRDSYGDTAIAAFGSVEAWKSGPMSVHPFIGAAHYQSQGLLPLVGAEFRAGSLFTQVIASDGKPEVAVMTFGLTWPLQN